MEIKNKITNDHILEMGFIRLTTKLFCALLSLMLLLPTEADAAIGDWAIYSSYRKADKVVEVGNVLYVLADGRLFSYDPDDTSVETYDKTNMLSGSTIVDILPCMADRLLAVIYDDGNIDLLSYGNDVDVYNMPELMMKTLPDKTINDVIIYGSMLYISTGSGIVTVDVKHKVVSNFYSFGHNVKSVIVSDGTIYAACADGVFAGQLTSNLLDKNSWNKLSTAVFNRLIMLGDHIYGYSSSLYDIKDHTFTRYENLGRYVINDWNVVDGKLWVYMDGQTMTIDANGNRNTLAATDVNYICKRQADSYWIATSTQGLSNAKLTDGAFVPTGETICHDGPWRNYAYSMKMENGRLLITGGAFLYPEVAREGTLMVYEGGKWSHFDEEGPIAAMPKNYYKNLTDIVQDPDDPTHHFASAACSGLYEFRDYKFVKNYSCGTSPLRSILPNDANAGYYVRTTGLAFDSQKNLWMLNNECDTIVRILKADGTWTAYYYPEIKGYPTFDHIMFDSRGLTWINSRRSTSQGHLAGFLVVNTNGTINQKSDDTHKFISSFKNQDGTSYSPTLLNCIVEDLDGAVWIGSDKGPFVTYEPATVFGSDFYLTQVKVPRNDGSNLADYLLSGVPIKCIAIDGANRKWFGTTGNGVYLVSSDGTEIIEHFTVENSPLLSDEIFDIAIDGSNGEVFFATALGLMSYRGDATDPMSELKSDNVRVYPNPVRPEYTGNIVINGLASQTDVKIVNAAGRLVNQGTSAGGTYIWNGCTSDGRRAASGIYFVLAADSEGNEGAAAKFLMVK